MRLFFFNHWKPYLKMWFNPKSKMIAMTAEDFMNYLKDWEMLDEHQKENQWKILKYHFLNEKFFRE